MGRTRGPLARLSALVLALGLPAAARAAEQAKEPAAAGASFETLAEGAVKTRDVATLLAPFVDSCGGEMRELDRARCRVTTTYLKRKLPQQKFLVQSRDPAAIEVSGYDAGAKGYHLVLAGCLACTEPLEIGARHDPRFVTLATPDKGAASLVAGVPVSKSVVAFDDFASAKKWADVERPFLKAEFLFQPQVEGSDFTIGMAPGIALKLIGARVYNRCTGEILVSKPPSTGYAERPMPGHEDPACSNAGKPTGPSADELAAADKLPDELTKATITDVMAKLRPQLYSCYEKFHVPGALVLSYVVGGNGTVQSVQVGSTFAGTPTGSCAADIAKATRFPGFKRERQQFKYLFYLRRS
ncbi:MAG TPA: hypothetical protein VHG72_04875 [Polyangia bacterium]|nr:hypothetical protein [Polyangia bacterium]